MNKAQRVVSVLALLTLGYGLGSCGNDTEIVTKTEVKTIKVPTVVTHIEYKDKYLPLPQACIDATKVMPRLTASDGAQTDAVGKILLALQEKGTAAAFNEVKKINAQTSIVRTNSQVLSTASNERQIASSTFNAYMNSCIAAIAATQ